MEERVKGIIALFDDAVEKAQAAPPLTNPNEQMKRREMIGWLDLASFILKRGALELSFDKSLRPLKEEIREGS